MDRLAENLRIALEEWDLSENRLAEASGASQSTINRIASGGSKNPRGDSLRKVAAFFGVTMDAMLSADTATFRALVRRSRQTKRGVGEQIPAYEVRAVEDERDIDGEREVMVDEVDVEVSGGPGAWTPTFVETKFRMPFQMYWFREKRVKPENVRIMRVRGNSMEKLLFHGDRVMVDLADRSVRDAHVYVLHYGGGVKVKRLFLTADGRLRVVSENTDKDAFPDDYIASHDLENVYIVGRVIDKSGSGGL